MNRKSKNPIVAQLLRPDVFSICWDAEELSSDVTEGMDVLGGRAQTGNEQKLASSTPLYRLPAEAMAQIKGVSFYPRIWTGVDLPTPHPSLLRPPF